MTTADTVDIDLGPPKEGASKLQKLWAENYGILKLLYFVQSAAGSFILPFFSIFYKFHGIAPAQIGILTAIPPFVAVFSASLWTALADRISRHRLILIITCIGTAVSFLGIMVAHGSFVFLVICAVSYSSFSGPTAPLLDTYVLNELGTEKSLYGRQRLWASGAWGIFTVVAGFILDTEYLWFVFLINAVIVAVYVILLGRFVKPSFHVLGQVRVNFVFSLRQLLANARLVVFLFHAFVIGVCSNVINNFLFLFLTGELGANQTQLGLCLLFSILGEVPMFFWSKQIQAKIGLKGLIIGAHVGLCLRLALYAFLPISWAALPIGLLHGLTFAWFWAGAVGYVAECAPAGLEASAQGLLSSVFSGIGQGTGSLLGGFLFEIIGARLLFIAAACFVFVDLVLYLFLSWLLDKFDSRKTSTVASSSSKELQDVSYGVMEEDGMKLLENDDAGQSSEQRV